MTTAGGSAFMPVNRVAKLEKIQGHVPRISRAIEYMNEEAQNWVQSNHPAYSLLQATNGEWNYSHAECTAIDGAINLMLVKKRSFQGHFGQAFKGGGDMQNDACEDIAALMSHISRLSRSSHEFFATVQQIINQTTKIGTKERETRQATKNRCFRRVFHRVQRILYLSKTMRNIACPSSTEMPTLESNPVHFADPWQRENKPWQGTGQQGQGNSRQRARPQGKSNATAAPVQQTKSTPVQGAAAQKQGNPERFDDPIESDPENTWPYDPSDTDEWWDSLDQAEHEHGQDVEMEDLYSVTP